MITTRFRWCIPAALLLCICGCARTEVQEPAPGPAGVAIDVVRCMDAETDADRDRLGDACELALARAFAPLLMMHRTRCTPPGVAPAARIPGGYFHAAQRVGDGVRLVYMPAYYRDCGWRGVKCVFIDCTGHAGDSELIVIDVREGPRGWYTDAIFLSAHCFGRVDLDCRWYRGSDLSAFEWLDDVERGAPIVWVSDARNANYPSPGACSRGHMGFDGCDRDSVPYRFPVAARRNIGSRDTPIQEPEQPPGCVTGAFVEPFDRLIVSPDALECFWDPSARFRGWQDSGEGTTPYGRYLERLEL